MMLIVDTFHELACDRNISNTPPHSHVTRTPYSHLVSKMFKLNTCQWFGKDVGFHILCWTIFELHFASLNLVPHKVIPNVHMFGAPTAARVFGHKDCALIVNLDCNW